MRSHLNSSWSLGWWNLKPQPRYCGLNNNRTMLTLSVCVCVYFKQCNKNGCWAQDLWLLSGMGRWYEMLDVLKGVFCMRSLKSEVLNSTLQHNDKTTWHYTTQCNKGNPITADSFCFIFIEKYTMLTQLTWSILYIVFMIQNWLKLFSLSLEEAYYRINAFVKKNYLIFVQNLLY